MRRAVERTAVVLLGLLSALCGCSDSGYQRKGGQWWYSDTRFTPLDPASFKPLDAHFGRDAHSGYYRGSVVAGSHGPSFEVLGEHEARDRAAVYYADTYRKAQEYWAIQHLRIETIAGADAASYRVLGHGYARDARQAYYEGASFAVRDVASFVPLSASFARDAQRGYYERIELAGSDGASFSLVDEHDPHHARDQQRVYFGYIDIDDPQRGPHPVVRVLPGAKPQTLRPLGLDYASDGQRVWWRGHVVKDVDAGSFALLEGAGSQADAQDQRGRFLRGRRVAQ